MKGKRVLRAGLPLLVLAAAAVAGYSAADAPKSAWLDNERGFKSDDAKYNYRRSEHFRIMWGKGVGEGNVGDFKNVTEQLAQGNLQMLEQVWHRFHDPESAGGMGFHVTGESSNDQYVDGKNYRINLMMNNTGVWEGGAWGSADEWGFPLFALPPGYLGFDPPSGATPHEYAHTSNINAGGFNATPFDGMWHEATSNWFMLQYNNAYPGPGWAVQPYLSQTHGRNYYDAWMIYEYMREQPGYGYAFINKVWTEAKGMESKGAEYIYDAMARLDDKHGPDSYNAIKDAMGAAAARTVTWDYERGQFFRKSTSRTMDPFSEMYRRGYTELERRNGSSEWFRVPFAHAPMQAGYNLVPIALNGKTKGESYTVNVNFKPLWDPIRHADMRATLVAVNDNGDPRYSSMWNGGINSITLADDENQLFLVASATPDFMGYEGFSRPLPSDLPLQPMAYEVSFPNTKATAYESKMAVPKGTAGKPHSNGGGFVADTAKVDASAYVGPNAMVLGEAQVLGNARISDFGVVMGKAIVKDNGQVSGHAIVKDSVQVYGNGKVRDWVTAGGGWKIYDNGRALERATLMDRGELCGNATIKGNVCDYGNAKVSGHAIKEYDCANGVSADHQVLMCWVWGADPAYADMQPDTGGLYAAYSFEGKDAVADKAKLSAEGRSAYWVDKDGKPVVYDRTNTIFAHDTFGVVHGYLMGEPKTVAVSDKYLNNVLPLNGKDQYIELHKDVADFNDVTYAIWVNWAGGAANQKIINFGDGGSKYAYLTPKGASGNVEFVISNAGKAKEQKLVGAAAIPANTWAHIAVTFRGDTGTLYVDGKPVATNAQMTLNPDDVLAENSFAGDNFAFIGRGVTGDYFSGMIDDFRTYVAPQDANVIAKLANAVAEKNAAVVASAKDKAPVTPKFLDGPKVVGGAIVMSATRPVGKLEWMEYSFKCVSGKGHNSGWISSNRWTDCNVAPGAYAYTVSMRNRDGIVSAESVAAKVVVSSDPAVPAASFAEGPAGISDSAIKMTAKKVDLPGLVEYKFTRNDKTTSGWQASNVWIDSGLSTGASYSYTVQVRKGANVGAASAAKTAVAKDVTPPARYRVGEWQTLPYATVDNKISLRAMPVYDGNNAASIEKEPVEYMFKCVKGNGPSSSWVSDNKWVTSGLPDGTYTYQFKIRDAAGNETPLSKPESVTITKLTGYHPYRMNQLARLPEGALVIFKGKVTSVDKGHYVVSGDGATIKVVPATKGDETDPSMNGKDVTVKGGLWKVAGEMRVTWADLK